MPQRRLHSLDALRGFAALSVVLWHWQHFFLIGAVPMQSWQRDWQPFFSLFKPAYLHGWVAVDLFFALSGFVFAWLYADAIAARRMAPIRFALLRFSRLYPLQWLMLVAAALLQWSYHQTAGTFFVYQTNNPLHFLLSAGLVQNWFHGAESFNGPSWSVSIEVLLYIVFFVLCRLRLMSWQGALAMVLVGFAVRHFHVSGNTGRGLMAFFVGCLAFQIAAKIEKRADVRRILRLVAGFALAGWIVVIAQFYWPMLGDFIGRAAEACGVEISLLAFVVLVVAPTIIALALHEWALSADYSRLSFLGDISYSTYMLHFPLQLALANIALRAGWSPMVFQSPFALIAFYAALIGLGWLSYRAFERPLQAAIRRRAGRHAAPPGVADRVTSAP